MRAALAAPSADGVSALVQAPATAGLLERAGLPLDALAQAMARDLANNEGRQQARAILDVQAVAQGGAMVALRYTVSGAPAALAVRYKLLQPMEPRVDWSTAAWAGGAASGTLPTTFARGARVLVMAEANDPALACRTRLGAVRKDVP
jgi:hypothetical protein